MNQLSLIDSPLFGASFVDAKMRDIFNFQSYVQRCIESELALARAQASLGVIPIEAAISIQEAAGSFKVDFDRLKHDTEIVGYPVLPIVEQLAPHVGVHGGYLHWGATTQDIMDTAMVLQVRDALSVIDGRLESLSEKLVVLASRHRATPMAGRTHLQHALPITFGYKVAVWLSAVERHQQRLRQLLPRVLVVQFSGAAGTLASLGAQGLDVQRELALELGLGVPPITWHSSRDSIAEAIQLLGLISGSLAKIAFDVSIMMTTELGEVAEPYVRHRGASSTMPQKQNPISCELIIAASKLVRQHAGLMLDAMVHDFERATGPWHLEWSAVPESFALTSGALAQSEFMLGDLQVFPDRMRANLAASKGLIVAEAVMMALAPHMGRQVAHDMVYAACRHSVDANVSLLDALSRAPEVTRHLSVSELGRLTDPANYLGSATLMVDGMLAKYTSTV